MPELSLETIVQEIIAAGFDSVNILCRPGQFSVGICRPEWVTSDSAQARLIPTFMDAHLSNALLSARDYARSN